jgi:hypothetical protein
MFKTISKFAFGATVPPYIYSIETPSRLFKTWRKQLEQVEPIHRMDGCKAFGQW